MALFNIPEVSSHHAFVIFSVIIFALVSFNFLFPCNRFIPLDRRTTAVVGALACYLLGTFAYPSRRIDLLHAIDFDVLVLLASIMVVNHLVVHLRETKKLIYSFQQLLRRNPTRGFWVLSLVAFIVSPFLTNDGVCLLFVEPVLLAFDPVDDDDAMVEDHAPFKPLPTSGSTHKIEQSADPLLPEAQSQATASSLQITVPEDIDHLRGLSPSRAALKLANKRRRNAEASAAAMATAATATASAAAVSETASNDVELGEGKMIIMPTTEHGEVNIPQGSSTQPPAIPAADAPKLAPLTREDAFYFLLALACATNIGSALTYTGNPQNMIVASDAIDVMPPYRFTLYMLLPSIVSFFITLKWVEICWRSDQRRREMHSLQKDTENALLLRLPTSDEDAHDTEVVRPTAHSEHNHQPTRRARSNTQHRQGQHHRRHSSRASRHSQSSHASRHTQDSISEASISGILEMRRVKYQDDESTQQQPSASKQGYQQVGRALSPAGRTANNTNNAAMTSPLSPLTPRRRRARAHEQMIQRVTRVVSSPFPYLVILLLFAMIVMIFVDVLPISALICIASIVMVLAVVFGNHWKNHTVWESVHDPLLQSHSPANSPQHMSQHHHNNMGPMTHEDKLDNLNDFFEELFASIDYSLLFIFLGTFIVIENMAETGIPRSIWRSIVGDTPFRTFLSITNISIFVVVASQLLGNVAVVQLARPNVATLDDNTKRLAWAIISFVSTVCGNLTITGSAANIIVAEKANRMDVTIGMDFWRHFRVCFGVTIVCCVLGAALLFVVISFDSLLFGT